MAQVTQDIQARTDWLLDTIDGACADLIEVEREWEHWSRHDHLEFRLGWPLVVEKLRTLQEIADRQLLTESQRTRYEQLMGTLDAHHSALDRLLAE
jgi:hypothetical protein